MLTGDKGETEHNIGISCGLIEPAAPRLESPPGVEKVKNFQDKKFFCQIQALLIYIMGSGKPKKSLVCL